MKSRVEEIIYRNLQNLLKESGVTERQCTSACKLNPNFFTNIRKGVTKHFRVCDVAELALFFDVTIDYLCDFKNTKKDFFMPNYKLLARDEKVLTYNFKKLDPVGRINAAEFLNEEIKRTKERLKNKKA